MSEPVTTLAIGDERPNPALKARLAGLAYVTIIVAALFSEMFVRRGAIVSGNPAATAGNILAREALWRWGGAAELLTASCDVVVALLLYEVLKPSGKTTSLLAAVFQLILVAISATKILLHMAPLTLLKSADTSLKTFTAEQLQDLAYLSLRLHNQAYDVMLVFFGVHCALIGLLIARADYLPRVLGWLMMVAGPCYIIGSVARFIDPQSAASLYPWVLLPPLVGEVGLALWLLIGGVNADKWRTQAARASTQA